MPTMNNMFPSKYLKATDCDEGDLLVTISDVRQESIGQGQNVSEKYIIYFEETEKGLVLNKINGTSIAKLYGDNSDDWVGQQITLYAAETSFQGEMVPCLRVRTKVPKRVPAIKVNSRTDLVPRSIEQKEEDVPF